MTHFKCECCGKVFDLDKAVVLNAGGTPYYICEKCDRTTNKGKQFAMCSECLAVKDATKGVFAYDNEHNCDVFTCDECILKSYPHVSQEQLDNMKKDITPSENTCACCGDIIPEGRQICLKCDMVGPERGLRRNVPVLDEWSGMESPLSPEDLPKTCSTPKHTIIYERDSKPVDIHKIIDDAMEKRDRTVSIYIGEAGVSVTVSPADQDKVHWIYHKYCDRYHFECSNCGTDSEFNTTYCHDCGELMHGVRKEVKTDEKET